MSDQPKDVGQVLKSEREKRAMTLEVVHEATKIPLDSLRAIEEGYKIRTLTTFYYKSFVKIYAQYLGLNAAEILAMVPGGQAAPKKAVVEETPKPSKISPKPVKGSAPKELNLFAGPAKEGVSKKAFLIAGGIIAAVIVLLLVSVVIGNVRKHFAVQSALNATKKKTAVKTVKPKTTPVKTVEAPKTAVPSTALTSAPATAPVVRTPEAVKPVKTASASVERTAEKVAPEAAPAVKAVKKASLTVRAPITVWLKVRVDGSTVYQGSLKKGNFETWSGSKRVEVSGKGITQLELEVNGKSIGKLGRPDTNAKKIIVTPEGMSVEK
jgi:cytoskeletal protein RodZ